MRASPGVITIISVNSPRLFDEAMADGLIDHGRARPAGRRDAVHADGRDEPVTLAAALAQQNAEALFGVVLTQLVAPARR